MRKFLALFFTLALVACGGSKAHVDSGSKLGLQTCSTPSQLDTNLTNASQSDVISLSGVDPTSCPEVSMTETWGGGKLIFSDSPEYPSVSGKLYEDGTLGATSGTDYNRIFLYEVNGQSGKKRMKFTVLLKNLGSSSGTLTVQQSGTAGPTTSYLYAGKMAFYRWLTSSAGSGVNVGAGATVRLDSTFDSTTAAPSYLMHGIWDYSFDQPHQITICALGQNDDPVSVCPGLSVLPRDTHQRGTFPYANKVYDTDSSYTIDTANGIQQLPMVGNTTNDTNSVGTDVTDGSSQTLKGNYGVLYRMHLSTTASDSAKLGFLFNPRGGTWGGAVWALGGEEPGGKFLIPPSTGSTGDSTKGAVEGKYNPGSGLTTWLQFMPVGGASFPLRFVAVPY
jgi:hypothetical protein